MQNRRKPQPLSFSRKAINLAYTTEQFNDPMRVGDYDGFEKSTKHSDKLKTIETNYEIADLRTTVNTGFTT